MKKEQNIIPNHIGIIMDGNRRWARQRGLPTIEGHRVGAENFKKIAQKCYELGVKYFTVFAFSTENWNRSEEEISYLMKLLENYLNEQKEFFIEKNIRLKIIGQIWRLPKNLQKLVLEIMDITKNNTGGNLNLAISYGGRVEIVEAVKKIVKEKISAEEINEKVISEHTYTAGQPDPDLIIRTSGEQRVSGFLTWQAVYSEIYFSPKMWPEFSEQDLENAIEDFSNRQRRFGK